MHLTLPQVNPLQSDLAFRYPDCWHWKLIILLKTNNNYNEVMATDSSEHLDFNNNNNLILIGNKKMLILALLWLQYSFVLKLDK